MNSTDAEQQKSDEHHGDGGAGGTRSPEHGPQQAFAAFEQQRALTVSLMEQVCDPKNLLRAYRRVRSNKGKPGVDGMTVHELQDWLRENNEALVASLLDGTCQSQPVRGVQIRKSGGGKRQLGIPVVLDRMVQQAILQVLDPIFDPTFSNSGFGFRSGRSPHMALEQGRKYVAQEGRGFVVDLDPEKFFDKVNHDILMSRIARRIGDKRLLRIIRRNRGVSLVRVIVELNLFLMGWLNYYRNAACRFELQCLDEWTRRKLRCYRLKQCKRGKTVSGFLRKLGASPSLAHRVASSGKGWWRLSLTRASHQAMSEDWFAKQGLKSLVLKYDSFKH